MERINAVTGSYFETQNEKFHRQFSRVEWRKSSPEGLPQNILDIYEDLAYIIKIEIQSSCEIEDFVETHLCKLCVTLRSRVLRAVFPH